MNIVTFETYFAKEDFYENLPKSLVVLVVIGLANFNSNGPIF